MLEQYTDEELCTRVAEPEAWNELYRRHIRMVQTIVTKMHERFQMAGERSDFLQNAVLSMFKAYQQFNSNKDNNVSTYVYDKVRFGLLSMVREEGHINCPTQKVAARLYVQGKYNKVRREGFEKKNDIVDSETRRHFTEKHRLLGARVDIWSDLVTIPPPENNCLFSNVIWHQEFPSEDELITQIAFKMTAEEMPSQLQNIYKKYFVNECSLDETAEQLKISVKEVRNNVVKIRNHFKKYIVI